MYAYKTIDLYASMAYARGMKVKRIAVYGRVSTDAHSHASQLREVRAYLRRRWPKAEVTEYLDKASGARIAEMENQLTTLRARLEVFEARQVPYTAEELALFQKPAPHLAEAETKAQRTERHVGTFRRSIALPTRVDAGKVSASYENGILKVTLPKAEEAKPKQIKVS